MMGGGSLHAEALVGRQKTLNRSQAPRVGGGHGWKHVNDTIMRGARPQTSEVRRLELVHRMRSASKRRAFAQLPLRRGGAPAEIGALSAAVATLALVAHAAADELRRLALEFDARAVLRRGWGGGARRLFRRENEGSRRSSVKRRNRERRRRLAARGIRRCRIFGSLFRGGTIHVFQVQIGTSNKEEEK